MRCTSESPPSLPSTRDEPIESISRPSTKKEDKRSERDKTAPPRAATNGAPRDGLHVRRRLGVVVTRLRDPDTRDDAQLIARCRSMSLALNIYTCTIYISIYIEIYIYIYIHT